MKNIKKMLMLSSLVVFTACVNQTEVKVKEEIKMKEKTLDIKEMSLQSYEEYIKSDRFMLEPYIKRAKTMDTSGIAYLEDGTKIEYSFDDKYISENITNKKYPFIEISKSYYVDTKHINGSIKTISDLSIGKEVNYNQWGQVVKIIDHDKEMRALGLNYKKVLEWADEAGIIDLKEAKILKGVGFYLMVSSMEQNFVTEFTPEVQKEFIKNDQLTKKQGEALFKFKNYWSFSVDYPWHTQYYMLAADGTYIGEVAKIDKMR